MKKLTISLLITILLTACSAKVAPAEDPPLPAEISPQGITAEGRLLPVSAVELAFTQPGVVSEIFVQPGHSLETGDLIARLAGYETAHAELSAAQLEYQIAQQALDPVHRSAFLNAVQSEKLLLDAQTAYDNESRRWYLSDADDASEIDLAIDDYTQAEKDYRKTRDTLQDLLSKEETSRERGNAQEDFDADRSSLRESYSDLMNVSGENPQLLTAQQIRILLVVTNLVAARERVERMEGNLDPDQLTAAEARLEAASAYITAAQAGLANFELRTPFAGILLSLDIETGALVMPGVPAAFYADTSRWVVETTDLPEIYAPQIENHDPATILLDAFPGEEFTGKVTAFDPIGRSYQGDNVYTVTITLDTADDRFLWNMTASVTIDVEE